MTQTVTYSHFSHDKQDLQKNDKFLFINLTFFRKRNSKSVGSSGLFIILSYLEMQRTVNSKG